MFNETGNLTIQASKLSYQEISTATQSIPIVTWIIITWFVPLFIYFLLGVTIKGRSASGQATSRPMISYVNFWYAILVWGLIQLVFFILLVFPIWLMPFK